MYLKFSLHNINIVTVPKTEPNCYIQTIKLKNQGQSILDHC